MSFVTVASSSEQPIPVSWSEKCRVPTHSITTSQVGWICKHTLGSAAICFGVNFAIVTLAFSGKGNVKLFEFPSTLAGAYALTMLIEISANWLITGIIMTLEVKTGKVAPLDPSCVPWWPKHRLSEGWWFVQFLNMTDLVIPAPSPIYTIVADQDNLDRVAGCGVKMQRLVEIQLRSAPWIVGNALTLLPMFTAITFALFGTDGYNDFPQPQILVGLFGALISLFTLPFWAINTLSYVGYRMLEEK